MLAQCLGEALAPALQVRLARVQPRAVQAACLHNKVDVWVLRRLGIGIGVIGMQRHDVPMPGELLGSEVAHGALHCKFIRPGRHRKDDIESLASCALFRDWPAATLLPLSAQLAQVLTAFKLVAILVF